MAAFRQFFTRSAATHVLFIDDGSGDKTVTVLEALCRELGCQPGELLEWTPDPADRDDTNIEKI